MKSLALRTRRELGERVQRELLRRGLLHPDLRVLRGPEELLFPVRSAPEPSIPGAEITEADFSAREPARPRSYAELVEVGPELRDRLPRAFDVVGDIALIRVPEELRPHAEAIGDALRRFVPGVRLVGDDRGVRGPSRVRELVRISGSGDWGTVHRENGLAFAVDVGRAYFSPRLAREHRRVAERARPTERFLDLCCGVGPFGLTAARLRSPRSVVLVDANPEATRLAEENARRLGVADRVRVVTAPLEEFLPRAGASERVVLNLPRDGIKYVTQVAAAVERGGTLHYYEIMERSARAGRLATIAGTLPPAGDWVLEESHPVHPYSPGADLIGVTLLRNPG